MTPLSQAPHQNHLLRTAILAVALVLISGCSQPLRKEKALEQAAISASDSNSITADIKLLKAQITQTPNDAELHYKLGYAYIVAADKNKDVRDRTLAINHFRQVLILVPGNPATLKLLYNIYYEDIVAGDEKAFAEASNVYQQLPSAIQLEVNTPSLGVFLNQYLAQKKSGKKNKPELYRALLAAIHEQPASDKAYIQLAKMYREEHYYPLALATLKLGAEQISSSYDLYQTIATTYEARADATGCNYERSAYIADAVHYYQQAVPLAPERADLHYALARLYLDQNLYQLALNESSILVELEPTAENIAFSAQNFSMLGNEQASHRLLAQAKHQGLTASDSAYHEIYMNSGEWMKASLSFTDYLQAQKNISVYDVIKADIIGQQADIDFAQLTAQKKVVFNSEWESAVYAYWTDKMTRAQLEQTIKNRCERTEYFFYSGYRDYRAGKNAAAKENFSAALQQNTYRFIERPLARHFLTGLGAK